MEMYTPNSAQSGLSSSRCQALAHEEVYEIVEEQRFLSGIETIHGAKG